MASVELATAYISLVPSMKGAQGSIARELGAVDADGIGKDIGGRMGGGITGAMKSLVGPALAGLAAVGFGSFIKEAAAASDATDKFKATMSFAGMDTTAVDAAKNAAADYAAQTVYDLPTIQNMTAQLASNGVKDYTGLTQAAGNLNAVAGGNADTFKSVAMVMTQTAGAGKLTTENWNQMADAIPGAAGPLMKALEEAGAYTGNFRDAMADGQITSDEFNAALQKLGTDPVAVEAAKSTKTFEGAIGNLQATINSGLMSALDALKPAITGVINLLANGLGKAFAFVGNAATGLYDLIVKGDFSGALAKAFHIEEDNPVVGFILTARQAISDFWAGLTMGPDILASIGGPLEGLVAVGQKVRESLSNLWAGLTMSPEILASIGGPVEGLVAVGQKIRAPFDEAKQAVSDFYAGLTMKSEDVASFGGDLEGLVAKGVKVREGLSDLWAGLTLPKGEFDSSELTGMVAVGAKIREVFGTIGSVVGSAFSQLAPVIGPLIPQFFALFSAISPIQTIFQALAPFIPALLEVFVQLAVVVGQALGTALTTLVPLFVQLQGVFISVFQQVLATVLPVIVQLVTMLGQTFAQLLPILMPIVTTIVELGVTLISQLMPIFMELVSTVLPMVVTIFGAVMQAIGPLISMVAGLLIPIIQALMPVVVTVFGIIADVITNAMQIVMGIIEVVTGIISGNWAQVWSGILNVVSGIFGLIVSVISGAIQGFIGIIGAGLNIVVSTFTNIFTGIVNYIGTAWNSILSGASGMLADLVGFFSGILGKITGAIGDVGGALFTTGKNIIQGLIDGIGSMMGAIGRAVINIVPEAIRGPFESLLGIHSPSRVFRGYGVNIGQGLVLGIGDMHGRIEDAVTGMVTVPDAPAFGSSTAAGDYRTTGGFGSTFNIYETDDPIATAHAVTRRQTALGV